MFSKVEQASWSHSVEDSMRIIARDIMAGYIGLGGKVVITPGKIPTVVTSST